MTNKTIEIQEPLILINVVQSIKRGRSVYDAVRCAWKVNRNKVDHYKLVLAHNGGQVIGAFRPCEWLLGTDENFPGLLGDNPTGDRWGFIGKQAEADVWAYYVDKRVPDRYRRPGAANPIRYCHPVDA